MSDIVRSIKMEKCVILDPISCCFNSVLPCNLAQLSKYLLYNSLKTARLFCLISMLIDHRTDNKYRDNDKADSKDVKEEEEEEEEEEIALPNCEKHDLKHELTNNDINMVMCSLGIEGLRSVEKGDKDLMEGACKLLDSKDASLGELEEAFYVFDRNEDGFITAFELWSVLRRLGLNEGMKYEDCEKMIRVYDKDGDGRISFSEFKDMMEQAL